jgi:hypothetical protein
MTLVKDIPIELARQLDVHEGDKILILMEKPSVATIRVTSADKSATARRKGSISEWIKKYQGIAPQVGAETRDDVRTAHLREKYGD